MTAFAALFALLYVGHLLGDYVAQTDRQATRKVIGALHCTRLGSWGYNQAHVATYTLTIASTIIALATVGGFAGQLGHIPAWAWLVAAAFSWVTHSLIDRRWPVERLMTATGSAPFLARGGAAYVDQALHLFVLALAAAFLGGAA